MNKSLKLMLVVSISSLMGLSACQTIPSNVLQLSPQSLEIRQIQTRQFDGLTEDDALAAAAGILQDMGFTISESETKLGLIVGNKDRSAVSAGQVAGAVLLTLLSGAAVHYDDKQRIIASLVTTPVLDSKGNPIPKSFYVRVTFARLVWNTANQQTKVERITDPQLHQEFFDKFSKAVFLDGQKV